MRTSLDSRVDCVGPLENGFLPSPLHTRLESFGRTLTNGPTEYFSTNSSGGLGEKANAQHSFSRP
jgi:hypothetical protein